MELDLLFIALGASLGALCVVWIYCLYTNRNNLRLLGIYFGGSAELHQGHAMPATFKGKPVLLKIEEHHLTSQLEHLYDITLSADNPLKKALPLNQLQSLWSYEMGPEFRRLSLPHNTGGASLQLELNTQRLIIHFQQAIAVFHIHPEWRTLETGKCISFFLHVCDMLAIESARQKLS